MMTNLVEQLRSKFDLIISFQGSVSCSPHLRQFLINQFDSRFILEKWDNELMQRLWQQQNDRLKAGLQMRHVLVLVDDIAMDYRSKEQFAHLCQRGRHCGISVFICCVSYTVIPKCARRSLDILFLFDLPMSSCKKILLNEFSKNPSAAEFYLSKLPPYTCLVLSTDKDQQLYHLKTSMSLDHAKSQNKFSLASSSQADCPQSASKNSSSGSGNTHPSHSSPDP